MSIQANSLSPSPVRVIHDYARRNKISAEYVLESESGPAHKKVFTMKLRLGEKEYIGVDRSIKLAQRAAADNALKDQEAILQDFDEKQNSKNPPPIQSATVHLNTWTARQHIPTKYIFLSSETSQNASSVHSYPRQVFYYRLIIADGLVFDGFGTSHCQARAHCASQALFFIDNNPSFIYNQVLPVTNRAVEKSPITLMYERAKKLSLTVNLECQTPNQVTYRIGEHYSTIGTGINKQTAKQQAAEKMLEILPDNDQQQKEPSNRKRNNQHKKFIQQKGSVDYSWSDDINPITRLYQIAQARNVSIDFESFQKSESRQVFQSVVHYGDELTAEGMGQSKQAAKRNAAQQMLLQLNPDTNRIVKSPSTLSSTSVPGKSLLKREENSPKKIEKKHVHFREDENGIAEKKTTRSCGISIREQLIKACNKLNIEIEYQDESVSEEPIEYQSLLSLSTGDRLLAKFRGLGPSLERARENVSHAAWKNLRQLFNGSIPTPKSDVKTTYQRERFDLSKEENGENK